MPDSPRPSEKRPYDEYRDPPATHEGRVVLYRLRGDKWQVARNPDEAASLMAQHRIQTWTLPRD